MFSVSKMILKNLMTDLQKTKVLKIYRLLSYYRKFVDAADDLYSHI